MNYTFYYDSWSDTVIKTIYAGIEFKLNGPSSLFEAMRPTELYERGPEILKVGDFRLGIAELAKYDLAIINQVKTNIFDGLYGTALQDKSVEERLYAYLDYLAQEFLAHIHEVHTTCIVIPMPFCAGRAFISALARSLGIAVVAVNIAPFPHFVAFENDSPLQTGCLSSTHFWNRIKCINFSAEEDNYFGNWKYNYIKDQSSRGCESSVEVVDVEVVLPKDFVFIVGQSPTDANQIVHQRHLPYSPETLAAYLINYTKDIPIVFKKHPEDKSTTADNMRNLEITVIEDNINIHEVISKAKIVFTWNSNVGIEALVYGKPVVVIGEAYYRNKGITYDLDSYSCIKDALEFSPDSTLTDQFLQFLVCRFLVIASDTDNVALRITELAEHKPSYGV